MTRVRSILCIAACLMLMLVNGCGTAPSTGTAPVAPGVPEIIKTKSGVEMVLIPAGTFEMGSAGHEGETQHKVTLDAFYMDRTEVTQAQFNNLSLPSPAHFQGPNNPVEQITVTLAVNYCNERSKAEGLTPCYAEDGNFLCNFAADGYRLPTEAEWEYACRAGSDKDYSFGADPRKLGDYAWYADNSGQKAHPVAQKRPNAWGLYDMHGNVAEWCNDYFDKNYYKSSPASNPHGPVISEKNAIRGGAWESSEQALRSAKRTGMNPGFQDACFKLDAVGFRCVRKK